jgi:hypothetical protein
MATSYDGPATLRTERGEWSVQVRLATTVGAAYSWQGSASTSDIAALDSQGHGGTLTLPVPPVSGEVHVAVTELHPGGGVILHLHGAGRAPYEVDGDIVTTVAEGGEPTYAKACRARTVFWPDDEGCDAECVLPIGHEPNEIHEDAILGTWNEDDLITSGGREWGYRYADWRDSVAASSRWYAEKKAAEDHSVVVVYRDGDGPWVEAT